MGCAAATLLKLAGDLIVSAVDLYCAEEGTGPALVLLHPVGLDHTFWGALVPSAARTRRVVAFDLRGHGLSPPARKVLRIEDYVADVHAAMTRLRTGPAVVLGLSFGGMIAKRLALDHPGDVAALVLCGCSGGFSLEIRPMLRERGSAAERGGMAAVAEPTIKRWFTPPFRWHPSVGRVRERLLRDDPAGWSAAWHAIAEFDAMEALGEIRVPTLVVAGECDAATPVAAASTLAGRISGARLAVLPGAPHMMQIESAEAFGAAVGGFLADPRAGAPHADGPRPGDVEGRPAPA